MSNSKLINYTKLSPNCNHPRKQAITKITVHHMAGNLTVERCGDIFAAKSRQASSNYGIGSDGRIALYVNEEDRAWTSGSSGNDNKAVTIEVANNSGAPGWTVSAAAYASLINLCVDICQRNGIKALNYTGDENGNLTEHRMFQATACPGPYLHGRMAQIAADVNAALQPKAAQPTESSETVYTVVSGDTLSGIAAKYSTTYQAIAAYNGITNPSVIHPGQKIKIPKATKSAASSKPTATKAIKVGSTVKIKSGAKDMNTGKKLALWAYLRKYTVKSMSGSRCVLTYNGTVVAAISKTDLTLV